jgi:hypothetical protein
MQQYKPQVLKVVVVFFESKICRFFKKNLGAFLKFAFSYYKFKLIFAKKIMSQKKLIKKKV